MRKGEVENARSDATMGGRTDQSVLNRITVAGEGRKQTLEGLHDVRWRGGEEEGEGAGRRNGQGL